MRRNDETGSAGKIMQITIRGEQPRDAAAISQLTERAFRNADHANHQEHNIIEELRTAKQLTLSELLEKKAFLSVISLLHLFLFQTEQNLGMVWDLWQYLPLIRSRVWEQN